MLEYRVVRCILDNPNWEEHILSTDSYGQAKLAVIMLMHRDIQIYGNQAVWSYMIIDNYTEEILYEVHKK
jgi:hypothetical protein